MKSTTSLVKRARAAFGAALLVAAPLALANDFITVASTTSTEQSGLFKHLLPAFTKDTGIDVHVVAVGTGQALDMGRRCDADVEFVHDKAAEEKFLGEGWGVKRNDVMYNDFVLVGPKSDPAKVKGLGIDAALKKIAEAKPAFVSRADKSGTWLSFKTRGELEILVEGDPELFNQYGVMLVNPAKCPHVKKELGQKFVDWVLSAKGRETIKSYQIEGKQLFFPNAKAGS